jgi:hypothetical protein
MTPTRSAPAIELPPPQATISGSYRGDGFKCVLPNAGIEAAQTLMLQIWQLQERNAPVLITVPSAYGHYTYDTISAVFHTPFMPFIPGRTIVQVAP